MKNFCAYKTLCRVFCIFVLSLAVSVCYALPAPDVGTAFNGPHVIPGTIEGEDFNAGTNYNAYYADTPGNQGNSAYRSGVDVDVYFDTVSPAIIYASTSTIADKQNSEWTNYTFQTSTPGWYEIICNVRTSLTARLVTLFNDRAVGGSGWIFASSVFNEQTLVEKLYIPAGEHVLKLAFRIPGKQIEIDYIRFVLTASPDIEPVLINTVEETVVATAVVTKSPFNADSTGQEDATSAIQAALDTVASVGGGTVFVPAGMYRINGKLLVPGYVTLMGDWRSPLEGGSGGGTILMACHSASVDDDTSQTDAPFITLAYGKSGHSNACVRNLGIWYPGQTVSDVKPYSYTIRTSDSSTSGCNVFNITLYNSYNGIKFDASSGIMVGNIYGTVLQRGYEGGHGREYSQMYNIKFTNDIWANAPSGVITNAPKTSADIALLNTYTTENLDGVRIGENDSLSIYDVSVKHAKRPVVVGRIAGDEWSYYGNMSKIDGDIHEVGEPYRIPGKLHYQTTDLVPETKSLTYDLVPMPKPAKTDRDSLYDVIDYGAAGDGAADDQPAIQAALDAAGAAGGGTVYLPVGQYKVSTHLNVPAGVELRGPCATRPIGYLNETCVLTGWEGRDTAGADTDTALITLNDNSGIRGFTITYPQQGFTSILYPIVPFPYTVRGNGSGVWVIDINFSNSYNTIDLATNRCDGYIIASIWLTVLNKGIDVSANSDSGRLERMNMSYGVNMYSLRQNGPAVQGYEQDYIDYTLANSRHYLFGDCSNLTTFGTNSWCANVAQTFYDDSTGGCKDSTFWHCGLESAEVVGLLFESGDNIHQIGPSRGGSSYTPEGLLWMKTTSAFTGTVNVYDKMLWGAPPGQNIVIDSGTVNLYNDVTLVSNRPVTASGYFGSSTPQSATDGSEFTKWACTDVGIKWLGVDLGQPCEINRWHVKNAGVNPLEDPNFNTDSADLEYSSDDIIYTKADGFISNTRHFVDRGFDRVRARYVKLKIIEGTQPGYDGYARIAELMVYGKAGWHFTNDYDLEGWTANGEVVDFNALDGKLMFTVTGPEPAIYSSDNLSIDTSLYDKVKIRMRNGTSSAIGQVFFITDSDQSWNEAKSQSIETIQNDSLYTDYLFDFGDTTGWTGTLKRLRFDPADAAGNIDIDFIMLTDEGAVLKSDYDKDDSVGLSDLVFMAQYWLRGSRL